MTQNHLDFEVGKFIQENTSLEINQDETHSLFGSKLNLYSEEYFREMFILEHKRAERSKNSFLFMLLDIKELVKRISFKLCRKKKKIKKIVEMLSTTTREIDIKGWYKKDQIIGIIFTELDGEGRESLVFKIKDGLTNAFNASIAAKVNISCFTFPAKKEKGVYDGQKPYNGLK